jgi:hypothetical protein
MDAESGCARESHGYGGCDAWLNSIQFGRYQKSKDLEDQNNNTPGQSSSIPWPPSAERCSSREIPSVWVWKGQRNASSKHRRTSTTTMIIEVWVFFQRKRREGEQQTTPPYVSRNLQVFSFHRKQRDRLEISRQQGRFARADSSLSHTFVVLTTGQTALHRSSCASVRVCRVVEMEMDCKLSNEGTRPRRHDE